MPSRLNFQILSNLMALIIFNFVADTDAMFQLVHFPLCHNCNGVRWDIQVVIDCNFKAL